jgi:hypothetical protein
MLIVVAVLSSASQNMGAWGRIHDTLLSFVTYKWAKLASVIHYTRLEMLALVKHSSFLGPFVIYEENDVSLQTYSQHFIFLVTLKWAQ